MLGSVQTGICGGSQGFQDREKRLWYIEKCTMMERKRDKWYGRESPMNVKCQRPRHTRGDARECQSRQLLMISVRDPGTAKERKEVTRNVKYALNVGGNAKSHKAENDHVSIISRTKLRLWQRQTREDELEERKMIWASISNSRSVLIERNTRAEIRGSVIGMRVR